MTRTHIWFGLTAITALLLFAYGPLIAGYVLAFAAIAAFVGVLSVHIRLAIDGWRLNHGWSRRQETSRTRSQEAHRRAA